MTNQEARWQAIVGAYGDKWQLVKDFCNEDGWITDKWIGHGFSKGVSYETCGFKISEVSFKQYNSFDNTWMLTKLCSLNYNNGWTRIESDGSNLPDNNCFDDISFLTYFKGDTIKASANGVRILFNNNRATHYMQIHDTPNPIY